MKKFILIIPFVLLLSCGTYDHYVNMGSPDGAKINLQGTTDVSVAWVTINDSIVLNEEQFEKLTLDNLPAGQHTVTFTGHGPDGGFSYDYIIRLDKNSQITKIIPIPDSGSNRTLYGLGALAFLLLLI